jgi:hypothetical protein
MDGENTDTQHSAFMRGRHTADRLRKIDILMLFGFGALCGVAATALFTWILTYHH